MRASVQLKVAGSNPAISTKNKIKYMKKLWIKLFGEVSYCRTFHTSYGENNQWHCEKCGIFYDKKMSDDSTGPR